MQSSREARSRNRVTRSRIRTAIRRVREAGSREQADEHRRAAVAQEARRMMRHLVLISIAAFVVAMLALSLVKHELTCPARELAALELDLKRHVEAIRVLRSEWSYLTRPARLAALAERHLPLEQLQAAQVRWLPDRPARPSALVLQIGGELER